MQSKSTKNSDVLNTLLKQQREELDDVERQLQIQHEVLRIEQQEHTALKELLSRSQKQLKFEQAMRMRAELAAVKQGQHVTSVFSQVRDVSFVSHLMC